jgi:NAD-dependent deacetylase
MKIVILTGAGVSAESGLGTFRDVGGLWSQYDLEDVATPEGFARDPALVHRFYNARRANCLGPSRTPRITRSPGFSDFTKGDTVIVTQNVDDLHERGGADGRDPHARRTSPRPLRRLRSTAGTRPREMAPADPCPACGRATTRPDVVWFGEMPYRMDEIETHLATCDLFVAIGTSGRSTRPRASWPRRDAAGARTLELNLEPSDVAGAFHEVRRGPATQVVPDWVDEVLGQPPMP